MSNKLDFKDFVRKVKFILGDKISINDLTFNKVELYHIKEFSNLNDEKFVEEMYKILLRRIHDEGGKQGKLDELKHGKSRKDIIIDMMNSEEGQNHLGKYDLIGLNYQFNFVNENILYKIDYSENEFKKLVDFLNFRFNKLPDNIIDLLSYSGSEFVFLLYKILLKRDPDFIGFKSHLNASHLLEDKFNKIKNFLLSEEAKAKNSFFYDLKGRNVLEINMDNLFEIDEKLLVNNFPNKEFLFNFFKNESLFYSISLIASICNSPQKCFEFISKKIFLENRTIIETIYEEEIFDSIKEEYILIDYFNKIVRKNNFSIIDDIIRNNSYYISFIQSKLKEYFVNFNLINNVSFNLDSEIEKIVKFLKKVALKKDLQRLYLNDKSLEDNLNGLIEIVKEHEQFILENNISSKTDFSPKNNSSNKTTRTKKKYRNKRR